MGGRRAGGSRGGEYGPDMGAGSIRPALVPDAGHLQFLVRGMMARESRELPEMFDAQEEKGPMSAADLARFLGRPKNSVGWICWSAISRGILMKDNEDRMALPMKWPIM